MKKIALFLGLAIILANSAQALVVGADVISLTGLLAGGGGVAYVGFELADDKEIDVGVNYSSLNDDAVKTTGVMLRYLQDAVELDMGKAGWGVQASYVAVDGGTTTTNIMGLLTAELEISDSIALYSHLNVINYMNQENGASTSSYWLLSGPMLAYTGLKIYL